MTIVRIGATKKYASGWEQAFGKGGKRTASGASAAKGAISTKGAKHSNRAKRKAKRKAMR